MGSKLFKQLGIVSTVLFFTLVGSALTVSAQSRGNWEREQRRYEKQQQKAAKQQRLEQQRLEQARLEQQRYDEAYGRRGSVTRRGSVNGNQATDMGYQVGFQAGQYDRRKGKYGQSNVYRSSGGLSPNAGDPSAADYYYRQGYIRGYEDGYRGGNR
jgi:hypothetical protein